MRIYQKAILICAGLFLGANAGALVDDFDEEAPVVSSVVPLPDQANRHIYAGAKDEQDLEVQTSLAVPTRSSDGTPAPVQNRSEPDDEATHD